MTPLEYLERNRQALANRDPILAQRLFNQSMAPDKICLLQELPDHSFDLSVQSTSSEAVTWIYRQDPSAMVAQFWKSQKLKNPLIMAFYGLDLGYHIKHYLNTPLRKTNAYLIIEKSVSVFQHAMATQDWTRELQDPNITWVVGEELATLPGLFTDYFKNIMTITLCRFLEAVMWLPSIERDGAYYVAVSKTISVGNEEALQLVRATPESRLESLMNFAENIPVVAEATRFDRLKGALPDRTGVVVSSGPSLDKAIPTLKKIKDHVVIFACDSAVKPLLDAGITPHFVACYENSFGTSHLFKGLAPLPDTWLVTLPIVYPQTLADFMGPKLFIGTYGFSYCWLLKDMEQYYLGPCSSTMAFHGLNYLGCSLIVLMGQDLNYQTFGKSFEKMIRNTGVRCYNAIPIDDAANIEGAQLIEPEHLEALLELPIIDVPTIVRERLKNDKPMQTLAEVSQTYRSILSDLGKTKEQMLASLDEISRFCYEHPPTAETPTLATLYAAQCARFETMTNDMLKNEAFLRLLWAFITQQHIQLMWQYYALQGQDLPFQEKEKVLLSIWEQWFQEGLYWASRIEAVLRKNSFS